MSVIVKIKIGTILLILWILFLTQSVCYAVTGQFIFTVKPIVTGDSGAAKELRETIGEFWQDYLRME
jgi:hypothetical protein